MSGPPPRASTPSLRPPTPKRRPSPLTPDTPSRAVPTIFRQFRPAPAPPTRLSNKIALSTHHLTSRFLISLSLSLSLSLPPPSPTTSTPSRRRARACAGRVIAVGGRDATQKPLRSCEIWDPRTARWTVAASLNVARSDLAVTTLTTGPKNGYVLAAGGCEYARARQRERKRGSAGCGCGCGCGVIVVVVLAVGGRAL